MIEIAAAGLAGLLVGHLENSDDGRRVKNFIGLKLAQTVQGVFGTTSSRLRGLKEKKEEEEMPTIAPKAGRCCSCGRLFFKEDLHKGLICPECLEDIQEMEMINEPTTA